MKKEKMEFLKGKLKLGCSGGHDTISIITEEGKEIFIFQTGKFNLNPTGLILRYRGDEDASPKVFGNYGNKIKGIMCNQNKLYDGDEVEFYLTDSSRRRLLGL